jgi:two-component system C4-dicarboxylate transport sensor histidine kinase DctB
MVSIEDAISGALRLIHHRLPPNAVTVLRTPLSKDLVVRAERIRLEQILVNLLQNALDAL